ncbi:MAG TPA: acyl-CoA dehydrogenase, partial [Alphaproteobacteria bacterium]|nr:acyl-CoA dehydrogenase [Alphaproteobacteria bacterium]
MPTIVKSEYVAALSAAERLLAAITQAVRARVTAAGSIDAAQAEAHGLAWIATYVEALRQMLAWAYRLDEQNRLGEIEQLILQIGFSEYLAQIPGGIAMSQGEIARAGQIGASGADIGIYMDA